MSKSKRKLLLENFEFAKSAFMHQMNNYECFISDDYDKVKKALGLTNKDINKSHMLLTAWNSAKKEYYDKCIKMC